MPCFVLDRVEGGLARREARGARTGPLVVLRLSMKKSLFPVYWVGEIEASRAAAIFFFFSLGKHCSFLEKIQIFEKMEKKVSSRTFFSHPAAPPETALFVWTASFLD